MKRLLLALAVLGAPLAGCDDGPVVRGDCDAFLVDCERLARSPDVCRVRIEGLDPREVVEVVILDGANEIDVGPVVDGEPIVIPTRPVRIYARVGACASAPQAVEKPRRRR